MNNKQQLVADTVRFKGSDMKTAQDLQAGLAPTEKQVQANQAQMQATEKQSQAEQKEIAANKRFGELGEYNILGEVTVYFANGKSGRRAKVHPATARTRNQGKDRHRLHHSGAGLCLRGRFGSSESETQPRTRR